MTRACSRPGDAPAAAVLSGPVVMVGHWGVSCQLASPRMRHLDVAVVDQAGGAGMPARLVSAGRASAAGIAARLVVVAVPVAGVLA